AQPAHFSPTSRRILIGSGLQNGHHLSLNGATNLGRIPGSFGQSVFKIEPSHQPQGHQVQGPNLNVTHHSVEAVILGTYRQVFGRDVFDSQRQVMAETKLKGGQITMREFVRQLAKSRPFRQLYWESLYITKSIEYIHRRLLGRPTYGREELNRYYDLVGKQGFYALIDALIDSDDYAQAFGDDVVPYERYLTPRGYGLRSPRGPVAWWKARENPATAGAWMATHAVAPKPKRELAMAVPAAHGADSSRNGSSAAIAPPPAESAPTAESAQIDTPPAAAADPQPTESNVP
ncbi:phycobilisome rod-core linker polypeptide, partial [Nodosilinea sp. LEGE 07298]|uniref:phycobilisome rod-core linker polypeptide n=1 Tax=Nodosilinea sp. LEGE 07298 TaxID=2777970 RepID=UPI001882364C